MNKQQLLKVNIHPESINKIINVIIETNKQLTETIIDQMVKKNIESTLKIVESLQAKNRENEKLYTLKDMSKLINIKYRTLLNYDLPYQSIGKRSQKMYSLSEVREYLRR